MGFLSGQILIRHKIGWSRSILTFFCPCTLLLLVPRPALVKRSTAPRLRSFDSFFFALTCQTLIAGHGQREPRDSSFLWPFFPNLVAVRFSEVVVFQPFQATTFSLLLSFFSVIFGNGELQFKTVCFIWNFQRQFLGKLLSRTANIGYSPKPPPPPKEYRPPHLFANSPRRNAGYAAAEKLICMFFFSFLFFFFLLPVVFVSIAEQKKRSSRLAHSRSLEVLWYIAGCSCRKHLK